MSIKRLDRALTVENVFEKKYELLNFTGAWRDAFDRPECVGSWLIWGNSGNGKTSFTLQLIKELTKFGNVLLNSREEGTSYTLRRGFARAGLAETHGKLLIVNEGIEHLTARLKRHKSPSIVVIDSYQYMQINYKQYLEFKERFSDKLIIFISHADGKNPAGRSAKSVMYDAALKIWVEGYVAFSKGRYIGKTGKYTVWQKGAIDYWGLLS